MCHDDDWVNLAVADDSLVVNLLLRLHHPPPPPPQPLSLHLHWTVRQRRSRSVRRHAPHKKPESTRASPTTPLSWSGATSASGGNLDGYEESSRPTSLPQTSRSKVRSLPPLSLSLFSVSLSRRARRRAWLTCLRQTASTKLLFRCCAWLRNCSYVCARMHVGAWQFSLESRTNKNAIHEVPFIWPPSDLEF